MALFACHSTHNKSTCGHIGAFIGMCVCVFSYHPSIHLPLRYADLHICLCLFIRQFLTIDFRIPFNQLLHLSHVCCCIRVSPISS